MGEEALLGVQNKTQPGFGNTVLGGQYTKRRSIATEEKELPQLVLGNAMDRRRKKYLGPATWRTKAKLRSGPRYNSSANVPRTLVRRTDQGLRLLNPPCVSAS